ncbi:hypothetical protein niasHT_000405 [Heterodera trifolii]|uniref:Uncharacterized protein n=1 Tax=Heterodera trifolii TaxID=157864 RepID=A0ABD2M173_9BILA
MTEAEEEEKGRAFHVELLNYPLEFVKVHQQMCRIALPHICLYVLLCLYLLAGAWAFACIEHNAERAEQAKKLERIGW